MLSLFPHMHLRGKDFHYEADLSGRQERNDPQHAALRLQLANQLHLRRALHLPQGTTLHCTAHFDNSADNPANPDPSKPVRWGDQTWEEMMIGWFDIAVPKDTDIREVLLPQARGFSDDEEKKQGEAGQ